MASFKKSSRKIIEPINDPIWNERAKELLCFLNEWRTWKEIVAWGKSNGYTGDQVRNIMAYVDVLLICKNKKWINKTIL